MNREKVNYKCMCNHVTKWADIYPENQKSAVHLLCTECSYPYPLSERDYEQCINCKGRGCVEPCPIEVETLVFKCQGCGGCVPSIAWNMVQSTDEHQSDEPYAMGNISRLDDAPSFVRSKRMFKPDSPQRLTDTNSSVLVNFNCSCGNEMHGNAGLLEANWVEFAVCPCCLYPQPKPKEAIMWCPVCHLIDENPQIQVERDAQVFACHYCRGYIPKETLDAFTQRLRGAIEDSAQEAPQCSHSGGTIYRLIAGRPLSICERCFTVDEVFLYNIADIVDQLYICDCEVKLKDLRKTRELSGTVCLRCPNCDTEETVINNEFYRGLCGMAPAATDTALTPYVGPAQGGPEKSWIERAGDFAEKHSDDIIKLIMGFIPRIRKYKEGKITGKEMVGDMLRTGLKGALPLAMAFGAPQMLLGFLTLANGIVN